MNLSKDLQCSLRNSVVLFDKPQISNLAECIVHPIRLLHVKSVYL